MKAPPTGPSIPASFRVTSASKRHPVAWQRRVFIAILAPILREIQVLSAVALELRNTDCAPIAHETRDYRWFAQNIDF